MSIHKTFKKRRGIFKSVKSRLERYLKLIKDGKEVNSVFGFPKEKILRRKKIKKKEEVVETTTEENENE